MSGHSHWAGIKHKKEATDQKRGKVFSKLLAAVSAAAKSEPNPDFNPRLRTAILKAREASVPQENIERAVKHAAEAGANLEELTFEAYGPGGIAIMIEAISDNKNRTVQEIKTVLKESGGKWAESGSVRWAFEPRGRGGRMEREIPAGGHTSTTGKSLRRSLKRSRKTMTCKRSLRTPPCPRQINNMIALGIDPGTRRIGYGIVRSEGTALAYLAAGILKIKSMDDVSALEETKKGVDRLIKKYEPDVLGVEKLYFAKNQKTAIAVAQARGVILLAAREAEDPHKGIRPERGEARHDGLRLCGQGRDPQDGPPYPSKARP